MSIYIERAISLMTWKVHNVQLIRFSKNEYAEYVSEYFFK